LKPATGVESPNLGLKKSQRIVEGRDSSAKLTLIHSAMNLANPMLSMRDSRAGVPPAPDGETVPTLE
jgi:hypothetical protein